MSLSVRARYAADAADSQNILPMISRMDFAAIVQQQQYTDEELQAALERLYRQQGESISEEHKNDCDHFYY